MDKKTEWYSERQGKRAYLLILDKRGEIIPVNLMGNMVLGRINADTDADIPVQSRLVSRRHGEFIQKADGFYYRDLESMNGTYINQFRFQKNEEIGTPLVKLKNGDTLCVGLGKEDKSGETVTMVFTTEYAEDTVWNKKKLTNEISEINIGREHTDISLQNRMVSHNHASVFRANKGWALMDHNSTNGVILNGFRIDKPQYLYPGDVFRIASLLFFYDGTQIIYPVIRQGENLVIQITERSVWQKMKKLVLLQDTNLSIEPGEMVMILGGSGAGKTTFMNAVMGYEKAQGTIMHGDKNIYTEYEKMKYEIGYVPQQDLLRGSDTVYDTLNDAARMKMPKKTSREDRKKRVEEVLDIVGLKAEKGSQVSKISGGQRKRLSVAVELIADPSLLFLDEADSGLDGPNSEYLMENARSIADENKIVMVITHAPDRVAHLFDKVVVLAKSEKDHSGHLAFYGSIPEAYKFFGTDSLEGVVKRINRKDEGGGEGKADYYIEKYKRLQKEERR